MNFNISTINKFFAIILLISHMYILSMLNPYEEATKYNNHQVPLLCFSDETLKLILEQSIDTTQPLITIIEPTLSLNTICKKITLLLPFPKIIRTISLCYTIEEKNAAMKNLSKSINAITYSDKRKTALLLVYIGANSNIRKDYPLLSDAINNNDKQMVATLFRHKVSPNLRYSLLDYPLIFDVETTKIAKIFINQKVDLNIAGYQACPNLLWACILQRHSPELIKLYLDHKADVTIRDNHYNCLLHYLLINLKSFYHAEKIYRKPLNHVQIATLFLQVSPNIVNVINESEETPLDLAQKYCYSSCFKPDTEEYLVCSQLIKLFKQYNGKTAQELNNK